jgi:hypothetical protein
MNSRDGDSAIFTRAYDLLAWLVPATGHFPRAFRGSVTERMLRAALDCVELLTDANHQRGAARLERLRAADARLAALRMYVRLAHRWHWINHGQYEHVSQIISEIGRLLGGWQRATSREPD